LVRHVVECLVFASFEFICGGGSRGGSSENGVGVSILFSEISRLLGGKNERAAVESRGTWARGSVAGERIRARHSEHQFVAGSAGLCCWVPRSIAAAHGERGGARYPGKGTDKRNTFTAITNEKTSGCRIRRQRLQSCWKIIWSDKIARLYVKKDFSTT
jgi:hypothetical protein